MSRSVTVRIFLLTLLLGAAHMFAQSKQLIGSHPAMDGGFEGQTVGTMPTSANATLWSHTASAALGTVVSGSARTGAQYGHWAPTSTGKYFKTPYSATDTIAASKAYTIQLWYKTPSATSTTATAQLFISPADISPIAYNTTTFSFTGTSNVWTKISKTVTTGSGWTISKFLAGIKEGSGTTWGTSIDVDDFSIYYGDLDETAPDAPTAPQVQMASGTSLTVSWTAPATGVDGGGYMVVRGTSDPTTAPNANGIYALGNSVGTGTVAFVGAGTSFTDAGLTSGTTYYYRVYTVDKAFNYSGSISGNGTPTSTTIATVSTTNVSTILLTSATGSGGNVTSDGGASVTDRGVCWSTTSGDETATGSHTAAAEGGTGTFTADLTSLTPNTKYYYKAYAVNSVGPAYGSESSFTTLPNPPTVGTGDSPLATGFTAHWSAPTGQGTETFTYSVDVSTDNTFATITKQQTGISSSFLSATIGELNASTEYYFRVKAVNTTGSSDWSGVSAVIKTSDPTPTLIVGAITAFGNQTVNSKSAEKSYSVSGSYLTANVVITAPSGFEISTTSGSAYSSTLSLVPSSGNVSSTIYVRFHPVAATSYSDNITHASTGATSRDVAVSGTGIAVTAPTALNVTHKSDNIVRLTWTVPSGFSDTVLIFARSAGDVNYTCSGVGSAYNNANSLLTSAGTYGDPTADNYLVYSGTGTSVEVTGLTNATAYYFKVIAYSGDAYSSAASANTVTAVQPTTSLAGTTADAQTVLTWVNPTYNSPQANYWDEVIVVAKAGSAVDQTPSGDASSLTANGAFGSGTDLGSGSFIVYKGSDATQTVTGLTNLTTYYFKTFVHHGSAWSTGNETSVMPYPYAIGDYKAVASAAWNVSSTWNKWTSSGWGTSSDYPNSSSASVYIDGSFAVTCTTGNAFSVKNLYLMNGGSLVSLSPVKTVVPISVYGTTVQVNAGSNLGSTNTGDNADGLSLYLYNAGTTTITGTGGTISLSKLINYTANSAIVIDHDMTLNYHGSGNAGNAFAYYTNSVSGTTLTVNAGKTLTFAPWACFNSISSSHSTPAVSQTININGTLTFSPGVPNPSTATSLGWAGHASNYLSLAVASGNSITMNIGAAGTLNVTQFYPNGTLANNNPGGGVAVTINNSGVITISDTADFRKTDQFIGGSGTINLNGTILVGSTDGITASSALGPIRTTTRNYGNCPNFIYQNPTPAAQVTGDGLPGSVTKLTINNTAGVTLTNSTTVNGTLVLTSGTFDANSNLTMGGSGIISSSGGSISNYSTPIAQANVSGGTVAIGSNVTNLTVNGSTTISNSPTVAGTLTLSTGNLTVATGQSLTLGSGASLSGETAGKYVIGNIQTTRDLSGSGAVNVGGMGISIDPNSNNLGSTLVTRTAGTNGIVTVNSVSGIKRTWKITPTTQPSSENPVSVTLSWVSDDDNGKTISALYVWRSDDNKATWQLIAGPLDGSGRSVTFTTTSFSDFTLTDANAPLPVELSTFTASVNGRVVKLDWKTETEVNFAAFQIERKNADGLNWTKVTEIKAAGSSNAPKDYSYSDRNITAGNYNYRLKMIDNDGTYKYSKVVEAGVAKPTAFKLEQNYPNPFNPTTTINYDLPIDAQVQINIYSITGQLVKILVQEKQSAGYYSVPFNAAGLASGTYIYQLRAGSFIQSSKMVILK